VSRLLNVNLVRTPFPDHSVDQPFKPNVLRDILQIVV
jgi:hypothetical protein